MSRISLTYSFVKILLILSNCTLKIGPFFFPLILSFVHQSAKRTVFWKIGDQLLLFPQLLYQLIFATSGQIPRKVEILWIPPFCMNCSRIAFCVVPKLLPILFRVWSKNFILWCFLRTRYMILIEITTQRVHPCPQYRPKMPFSFE